eukprot:6184755-Pyramimonas_sp.AAC.1
MVLNRYFPLYLHAASVASRGHIRSAPRCCWVFACVIHAAYEGWVVGDGLGPGNGSRRFVCRVVQARCQSAPKRFAIQAGLTANEVVHSYMSR